MEVTHIKKGKIVWTCVGDNIIEETDDNKEKGLHGFYYILFEENKYGGVQEGTNGRPNLRHTIGLWPGYWEEYLGMMHEAVRERNEF